MNSKETEQASKYFLALGSALKGLDTYLHEEQSPAYQHGVIAAVVSEYLDRLQNSLQSWENKIAFEKKFRVSQTESGFPAFQNVLDLQNDRAGAIGRLDNFDAEDTIRQNMVDHILSKKSFPADLQKQMAERRYLQAVQKGKHFSPLVLPRTVRVSVNPKTGRPFYVVHWGFYDGAANLPMIYMATIEDSSEDIKKTLVSPSGKLNKHVNIKLPVDGLLNPELALQFDDFCEKNSAYSLIRHGEKVDQILARVRKPENAWLMTWTMQEIFSISEQPAKWGLWGGEPARETFHINTDDLEATRMGVSDFRRNALVPHEAYQAIYASGQETDIFNGYQKHVISDGHVLRNM